MKGKPNLTDVQLAAFVQATYDLEDITLHLGNSGEDTWGYHVTDTQSGKDYFLKVYPQEHDYAWDAIVRGPHLLAQQGIRAVGPVDNQIPICEGFHVLLYPMIEGPSAVERPFNAAQLTELGRMLAQVHGATETVTAHLDCPVETFDTLAFAAEYQQVLNALLQAKHSPDPYRRQLAELLLPLRPRLQQELDDFVAYGQRAQVEDIPYVLCHADPSIGNVIAVDDAVYLIDWDGIILAPKERDLMHFGADDQPPSMPVYEGYEEVANTLHLNQIALRYYQLHWNIQEVIDYGARLLFQTIPLDQKMHDLEEMKVFLDYSGLASCV